MSVRGQLLKLKETVLDLLYPSFCIGCGREGELICSSCLKSLPRIEPPICLKCGKPIDRGNLCRFCEDEPPKIDGIRSPFRFDGLVKDAIYQLKYKNLKAIAHPLAQLMSEYLEDNPLPSDVLVPVPLHQRRIRERGYNQCSLLAGELGGLISLPVVSDSLVRKVNTPPQTRMSAEERKRNVSGAFSCGGRLRDKAVILIDDVSTTGATLESCAIALKEAGALSVWGFALAREI